MQKTSGKVKQAVLDMTQILKKNLPDIPVQKYYPCVVAYTFVKHWPRDDPVSGGRGRVVAHLAARVCMARHTVSL